MILILLIFLFFYHPVYAQESSPRNKSVVNLIAQTDMSCFDIQTGVCPTPKPPFVGVSLRYWEPVLLMETVKAPGDYVISEAKILLNPFKNLIESELKSSLKNSNPTSSSLTQSMSSSRMQFNESHLYDYPLHLILQSALCPSDINKTFGLRYLSEVDCVSWRRGDNELQLSLPVLGSWGRLYPRVGFLPHFSSLVASAATSVRAVSIAGDFLSAHVVESKLDFMPNLLLDKIQMVYPHRSKCFSIGNNMPWFEQMHSKGERYVWIYWRYRQCCKSVAVPS